MSNLNFEEYEDSVISTAYFLEQPNEEKQLEDLGFGFREEFTELLTDEHYNEELIQMFWGLEVDPTIAKKLEIDRVLEAGDVLFYIAATGLIKNIPLAEVADKAVDIYSGKQKKAEDFTSLDKSTSAKMSNKIKPGYNPNYKEWLYYDMPRYHQNPIGTQLDYPGSMQGSDRVVGPIVPIDDGFYSLLAHRRAYDEIMFSGLPEPRTSRDVTLVESALLLGNLSLVLQNRFNGTLEQAALQNIEKRERRKRNGTLMVGPDNSRSRSSNEQPPRLTSEQTTKIILASARQIAT